MRTRFEDWGAWIKIEEPLPALVALDRAGLEKLGIAWTPAPKNQGALEVHLAVTSRCGVGCEGCYLDATPDGAHVPRAELLRRIDRVADEGGFTIAFGGGEPILRDDLDSLAEHARARGLTPVITTSGIGMTSEKARMLRAFEQVNVSYDGEEATYEAVRGVRGAKAAERAIALLTAEGVRVGVNVVLTRQSFPRLSETLDRARVCGAFEAQLLRWKPAGRAARLDYLATRLSAEQVDAFASVLRAYVALDASRRLRLRIDCALVPFLSMDPDLSPERLIATGVFGCEAGAALSAMTVDGRTAPCSFSANGDPERFRAYVDAAPEPCASCPIRRTCRGGCKVVTAFVDPSTDGFAPDPECPRVRARNRTFAKRHRSTE